MQSSTKPVVAQVENCNELMHKYVFTDYLRLFLETSNWFYYKQKFIDMQ